MFDKILIANRGEIACRIVATARRLGIATVAVYSDADRGSLHVAAADQAVRIGEGPATDSYLRIDRIIAAAQEMGAQAIHPGYGFLAENPDFAEACRAAGLVFIGPSPDAMRALGGKAEAKTLAEKAGVPVVPGYQEADQAPDALKDAAGRVGYPVMIKAVAGGGGRGMRLVEQAEAFEAALESATREAAAAFGDARVLIEKRVVDPRHIEVQVFGDSHGNVVHMFERDCTLQRRNQKVIEEAPAPGMSPALRGKMTGAAVRLAQSVGYEGAGTVEFLVEGGALSENAPWYFIEMNTRLQVEHPVTEAITGLDLVEWQLRVAAGESLPCGQDEISMRGHAIEARVCAEDPDRDFAPSIGVIRRFDVAADEVRVETGFASESEISPFYDSLIAKLITHGVDRDAALEDLLIALRATCILGVGTNLGFLAALADLDDVRAARMTTGTIAARMPELAGRAFSPEAVAEGVRGLLVPGAHLVRCSLSHAVGVDPWGVDDGFQLSGVRRLVRPVVVNGEAHAVELVWRDGKPDVALLDGEGSQPPAHVAASVDENGCQVAVHDAHTAYVLAGLQHYEVSWPTYEAAEYGDDDGSDLIRAPINGRVVKIHVGTGDVVEENQPVAVVEAMKMEHVLVSPRAGVIARVAFAEGDQVNAGAAIATLEAEEAPN